MIHFALGTKAQFIKMAPLMHLLQQEGERYHLLDLSQHGSLTGQILADFRLSPETTRIGREGRSVTTYAEAAAWFLGGLAQALAGERRVRERLFLAEAGVVLLHGDTLSTLLGLRLARAAGLATGLVEAGLTSGSLLSPFPEEWIRRHASRRADYLFAPDAAAASWLRNRGYGKCVVDTRYNTGRDAFDLMASLAPATPVADGAYGLVTLHRLETISSRKRLARAVQHVCELARSLGRMRFYIHPPTERALARFDLLDMLRSRENIEILGLQPYPQFVAALAQASFIVTDGGSIQEEASYLGSPCVVLRERTERREGLGGTVALTSWDPEVDARHLRGTAPRRESASGRPALAASRAILEALREFR